MTTHLSEIELQEYALHKSDLSTEKILHFASCARCQAVAANYQILVNELHQLPKPSFDFDISAAVIVKLQKSKKSYSLPVVLACFFSLLLIVAACLAIYNFWGELCIIITSTTPLITLFILSTVVLILGFHGATLYNDYQKKLKILGLA